MDDLDPESLERGHRPGQSSDPSGAQPGDQQALPKGTPVSLSELLATIFSRIALGLLLFCGFGVGFWVAGVALHDPDTCWLLALGRYILENHQIPASDPFSWTFAAEQAAGQHFVLYQWLSEVVFYASSLPTLVVATPLGLIKVGLVTLLLLCAVTISTAYLSIPMAIVVRRDAPFIKGAMVVILGMLAAAFHTLARPEIFSYLWLALFLQNTHSARVSSLNGEKKIFDMVFVLAPLMVLWANMHTGFVAGLAVLFALSLGSGLSVLFFKAPVKSLFTSASVALVGCFIAAFINPYGARLYAYIPELFNAPINKYIIELQPVIGEQLEISPEFYPFILLCLLYLGLMVREAYAYVRTQASDSSTLSAQLSNPMPKVPSQQGDSQLSESQPSASQPLADSQLPHSRPTDSQLANSQLTDSQLPDSQLTDSQLPDSQLPDSQLPEPKPFDRKLLVCELLLCFICGQVAIFNGLVHRRVASFVTLILVGEVIALLGLGKRRQALVQASAQVQANNQVQANGRTSAKKQFWTLLDTHSLDLWKAGGIYEMAIVALCAIAGVTLVSFRICKPELPASSIVFKTPFKAIDYIAQHQPQGKLYNDQQFGDVLIYYLKGKPKVFMDTRFDMYGPRLVQEYRDIHECEPGWKEKLDKLGVDWVFLRPDALLAAQLKKDSGWKTLYGDDTAVILERIK